MRPEERNAAHLWDMLDAARAVREFAGDRTRDEFLNPDREAEMVRMAIERKLEILGEAAGRVSEEFRDNHPEVPWKEIVGLRNVISHQYDKVDYMEVYTIVHERIPGLIALIEPLVPPVPGSED
ncbi:MAG: DUF86 domain-containing protein [Candidatus Hydrogenedentota bacterium]